MMYLLYKTLGSDVINAATTIDVNPQISFLFDPDNTDYQAYQEWLAQGNTPISPEGN